jgi:heptosyltransferase-3
MIRRFFLGLTARLLRKKNAVDLSGAASRPRILVIRRNRMGDMICTLPLLHTIRRHFPQGWLAVACDEPGAPIARACGAVNETFVLGSRGFLPLIQDARRLQGFDWVIAAKGGFDRRLALLARLSNGIRRVGYEEEAEEPSTYYTDTIPLTTDAQEHQIETQLELLPLLGISGRPVPVDLTLELPSDARDFAEALLAKLPLSPAPALLLINISSTRPLLFRREDFLALIARLLSETGLAIGVVSSPADQAEAREMADGVNSKRVLSLATPGPLELAALLRRATLFLTPEGGAAHLAAAMDAPAVVLWSEGPFEKWHSRSDRHVFLRAETGQGNISVDRVRTALKSLLP